MRRRPPALPVLFLAADLVGQHFRCITFQAQGTGEIKIGGKKRRRDGIWILDCSLIEVMAAHLGTGQFF